MMIITYRNFSTSSFVITSWCHHIPQLFHFLLCYNFMMIITYRNFSTSSFVITFSMIITYRNFFTFCFVISSWCLLHTASFPLAPMFYLFDNVYIPQLFYFFLCHNFITIMIYRIFIIFTYVITSWRLIHTATFPLSPLSHDYDDQDKPHFFHFLLFYNLLTIYTYCNLSSSLYVLTSWSSILTATFPLLPMLQLYDDRYIPQFFHFGDVVTLRLSIVTATFSLPFLF